MDGRRVVAALIGAVAVGASMSPAMAADEVNLYPPHVYPVAYEHLNRWCGPDALIINSADGQVLLRLDLIEKERTIFNDPIDPLVLDSGFLVVTEVGCRMDAEFALTYWQVGGHLALHRLQKDPGAWWTADTFERMEYVRLPSGFDGAVLSGRNLFLAYVRRCSSGAAEQSADVEFCAGVEAIDLETLDRWKVLERRDVKVDQGGQTPQIEVVEDAGRVTAMIVDEKQTTFCRIEEDAPDCRVAVDQPIRQPYEDERRRLTVAAAGAGFYGLGKHALYCDDPAGTHSGAPLCRVVVPRVEERPDAEVRLRAVLPDGLALAMVDQCLSVGEISPQSGIVRNAQCLLDPVRAVAPEDMRSALVDEERFTEDYDGVTIPQWDVSISPTGKWIAIQVPREGCGDKVPKPETEEPRVGVGGCGQVMIWPLDRFLR